MPYAAPRHCFRHHWLFSGTRCPDCERESKARAEARRPIATDRGYDGEWRKARGQFLADHPTCASCGAPATVVDHVTPHKGDRALFWERSNWQPLCRACHGRKTNQSDGGGFGGRTRR
jgi:5-methylcytosine-specific restriction protein A